MLDKFGGKSVKILHYIHGLPPVRGGGLLVYALDLAEGEQRMGNEVHLLVPGNLLLGLRNEQGYIQKTGRNFHAIILLIRYR